MTDQKPKQEPVAWYHSEDYKTHFTTEPTPDLIGKYWKPLYSTPRPWVGLTDEEIKALPSWWPSYEDAPALIELVKDVEAQLRLKNTK
jgi:hypothetical protein